MSFKDWLFGNGVKKLPISEYLYGFRHIFVLVLITAVAITLSLIFRKNKRNQKITLNIIVGFLIFFEITSRILNLIKNETWTFQKLWSIIMPCHFCSIVVVVFIIAYLLKKQSLINASVVAGFLATGVYFAYPGVGLNTDIITFSQIYSIGSHTLGMIFCILMVAYKQVDFSLNKIYQPITFFAVTMAYGLLLNLVIFPGSNYMYFMENELGVDVNIWVYRLILFLILSAVILTCYLPSIIKTLREKGDKK